MTRAWQTLEEFLKDCEKFQIPPLLRLLLASDGSTTRSFNSLFLTPITITLESQHESLIDDSSASQLEVSKGEKAIERCIWLKTGKGSKPDQKLLHAASILPISRFMPDIYQELQLGQKPLGQIIAERGLATHRDCFEVALLSFPDVAKELELKEDTLLWARRYRLSISGQISALIQEVFSPGLSLFSS